MTDRKLKNHLYEQVARIGKAASSPKRLELIEVAEPGEKSVEQLAVATDISVKLASAHLKELKSARLVEARREARTCITFGDARVADMWVMLRQLAEERLLELQAAMKERYRIRRNWPRGRQGTAGAGQARRCHRDRCPSETEYQTAHLPHAR